MWLCSGWIALSSLCEALLAAFVDARDTMLLQYHGSNPDEMPKGFGWCNPASALRTVSTHGSRSKLGASWYYRSQWRRPSPSQLPLPSLIFGYS